MGEAEGKLHWCLQEDCESKSGPFDEPSEGMCVRQALLWEMLGKKYRL